MKQWIMRPSLRPGVRRAWPASLQKFRLVAPRHRSRHVRGPMGAILLPLLDAGWDPLEPDHWRAPSDFPGDLEAWRFPEEGLSGHMILDSPEPVVRDAMFSTQSKLWRGAAEHWCGDGAQNGVDNTSHRRLIS
eukprot:8423239-Pyramimonas_sp.AAC.1